MADVGEPITVSVGVGMGETKALVGVVRISTGVVFSETISLTKVFLDEGERPMNGVILG